MQQRYYDPELGVFPSTDPVTAYDNGDMRFFNRYAYAFNNPYRFKDPDGRETGAGYATGAYTMAMPTDSRTANIGVAAAAILYGGLLPIAAVAEVDAKGIALAIGLAAGDEGGLAEALAAIQERKEAAALVAKIVRKIVTKDSTPAVSLPKPTPKPIVPPPTKRPPPTTPPPPPREPPPPPPREPPPPKISDI